MDFFKLIVKYKIFIFFVTLFVAKKYWADIYAINIVFSAIALIFIIINILSIFKIYSKNRSIQKTIIDFIKLKLGDRAASYINQEVSTLISFLCLIRLLPKEKMTTHYFEKEKFTSEKKQLLLALVFLIPFEAFAVHALIQVNLINSRNLHLGVLFLEIYSLFYLLGTYNRIPNKLHENS